MKILTREEAQKLSSYISFSNGDYDYKTEDGYLHLIRNGVDLLEGKKAIWCFSYPNGDYEYKTERSRYLNLIRNGIDLLEGKKAVSCHSFRNGDYAYNTEDGYFHFIEFKIKGEYYYFIRDGVYLLTDLFENIYQTIKNIGSKLFKK